MKELPIKVFKAFFSRKFLRFCLLGFINTFNTAWVSWVAHIKIQQNAAAVAGYAVSLTIAYFLNCRIVFNIAPALRGYLRFILSYIPNFIIYFLVTFITINTLELPQFWATIFASAAGGPITYCIIRLYAFGKQD